MSIQKIVNNLKDNELISEKNIKTIRAYIAQKYPQYGRKEVALVFADALHKIIDKNIGQFEEEHRKAIKAALFKKTLGKALFSINSADILGACILMGNEEKSYIESLTAWVEDSQPLEIPQEVMGRFVALVRDEYGAMLAEDMENLMAVLPQIEEQIKQEEDIAIKNAVLTTESALDKFEEQSVEKARAKAIKPADSPLWRDYSRLIADIRDYLRQSTASLPTTLPSMLKALQPSQKRLIVTAFAIGLMLVVSLGIGGRALWQYLNQSKLQAAKTQPAAAVSAVPIQKGLVEELRYGEPDRKKLKEWLNKKNSLLAEEPYFSAIIDTAKRFDVNPLLMFAITGQEQAFVPKSSKNAKKMANNPFNVYGSWQKYNTDIYDSAALAAEVLVKYGGEKPSDVDAIQWINRKYAEDKKWWLGVSGILNEMRKHIVIEKSIR